MVMEMKSKHPYGDSFPSMSRGCWGCSADHQGLKEFWCL